MRGRRSCSSPTLVVAAPPSALRFAAGEGEKEGAEREGRRGRKDKGVEAVANEEGGDRDMAPPAAASAAAAAAVGAAAKGAGGRQQ